MSWLASSGSKENPLVMVHALKWGISKHAPLLLESGEATHMENKEDFSFGLSWFGRECFLEMVAEKGEKETPGATNVEKS